MVLPEKFTKALTYSSGVFFKKSLTITDFPTPVSPVISKLKLENIKVYNRNLYLTVSPVGTNISKKLFLGSYWKSGIYSDHGANLHIESMP